MSNVYSFSFIGTSDPWMLIEKLQIKSFHGELSDKSGIYPNPSYCTECDISGQNSIEKVFNIGP